MGASDNCVAGAALGHLAHRTARQPGFRACRGVGDSAFRIPSGPIRQTRSLLPANLPGFCRTWRGVSVLVRLPTFPGECARLAAAHWTTVTFFPRQACPVLDTGWESTPPTLAALCRTWASQPSSCWARLHGPLRIRASTPSRWRGCGPVNGYTSRYRRAQCSRRNTGMMRFRCGFPRKTALRSASNTSSSPFSPRIRARNWMQTDTGA